MILELLHHLRKMPTHSQTEYGQGFDDAIRYVIEWIVDALWEQGDDVSE